MISIIISTLNEEKYLPMLLKSLEMQEGLLEILVVDGNSSDNTVEVVEKFASKSRHKVRVIPLSSRGLSRQRNTGVQHATYEQLLFLDADVVLPKDFIHKSLRQIREGHIQIAGTKILAAEPGFGYRMAYAIYSSFYLPFMRVFNPVVHGCSIFITKELHYKIGGFAEDVTFEDFRYSRMAAQYTRPVLLKEVYVRTSARRFYKASPRELGELIASGIYSLFRAGMEGKSFMKKFHEKYGCHEDPKY